MSVHKESVVVVLTFGSEYQLELFKKEVEQRYRDVRDVWHAAQESADCTDQIDADLDMLACTMENVMMELGVEGYEWS